jgi:hypothetical protein
MKLDIRVNDSYVMWLYGIGVQLQVLFDVQNEVARERQEQGLSPIGGSFGEQDVSLCN